MCRCTPGRIKKQIKGKESKRGPGQRVWSSWVKNQSHCGRKPLKLGNKGDEGKKYTLKQQRVLSGGRGKMWDGKEAWKKKKNNQLLDRL